MLAHRFAFRSFVFDIRRHLRARTGQRRGMFMAYCDTCSVIGQRSASCASRIAGRPSLEHAGQHPGQVHRVGDAGVHAVAGNGTQICAASPQMKARRSRNRSASRRRPIQSSCVSTWYSKSGPTPRICRMHRSRSTAANRFRRHAGSCGSARFRAHRPRTYWRSAEGSAIVSTTRVLPASSW